MAISVGILNLVLREYEGALALYPLVSDYIRNVRIDIYLYHKFVSSKSFQKAMLDYLRNFTSTK